MPAFLFSGGLSFMRHDKKSGEVFLCCFFSPFPQSSVQLMVSGILSDLVLSVNFSFTCSDFLDYFLHVQKLRERLQDSRHTGFQTGSPCSRYSGLSSDTLLPKEGLCS